MNTDGTLELDDKQELMHHESSKVFQEYAQQLNLSHNTFDKRPLD